MKIRARFIITIEIKCHNGTSFRSPMQEDKMCLVINPDGFVKVDGGCTLIALNVLGSPPNTEKIRLDFKIRLEARKKNEMVFINSGNDFEFVYGTESHW